MTTINTSLHMTTASPKAASRSSDTSLATQINQLTAQITKLTQKLKDVATNSGSAEDRLKQQEQIQIQIKLLQAQLAQLQRQQAEEASQKNQSQATDKIGINRPADGHNIDIYI